MIIKTPMILKLTVRSLLWSKCSCSHNRSVSGCMSACDARSLQRQLSRASRDIFFEIFTSCCHRQSMKMKTILKLNTPVICQQKKSRKLFLKNSQVIFYYYVESTHKLLCFTKVFIFPIKVFTISALCVLRFNFL